MAAMRLSMKAFSNVWFCVLELFRLQVAVLGASQVYNCTIGDTARIFLRRSERERLKEFTKYRLWKENTPFAVIEKGTPTARCLDDDLKPFCLTKVQFQIWNDTHLLLEIKNSNYEDSGKYGVVHVFGGMEGNHKDTIYLNIKAKPTDIIPSHRSSTKHGSKTFEKPTDIIPSHRNSTKDDNRTLDHSSTTVKPATISSGRRVLLTCSVPLIVLFLLFL